MKCFDYKVNIYFGKELIYLKYCWHLLYKYFFIISLLNLLVLTTRNVWQVHEASSWHNRWKKARMVFAHHQQGPHSFQCGQAMTSSSAGGQLQHSELAWLCLKPKHKKFKIKNIVLDIVSNVATIQCKTQIPSSLYTAWTLLS